MTTPITRDIVEQRYDALGYQHGWTLMYTPAATLQTAKFAFVGLNPGGGGDGDTYPYEGIWDEAAGNAYFDHDWGWGEGKAPIQLQIQKWHELLGIGSGDSLCIQFVPFRSPSWRALEKQAEALAFAHELWSWILATSPATHFLTMGKEPALHLADIINAEHILDLPAGWGRQTINVWESASGRRIVAMPHPSRYRLFGRTDGKSQLAETNFRIAVGL